ncbi:MAG TPA: DNA alkylation repair protein [Nitrolancea sp.]|jgi:3-methyladenine DNA glycosylase AlkD|nr:DNA alkylation repair protein [Nitrolancea sp.]
MNRDQVLGDLRAMGSRESAAGMARFGISSTNTLGISVPLLRQTARRISRDHALALELWDSGIHEARVLASMIDDPKLVTSEQMDAWVADFDSWDVCDHACGNLFDRTPYAFEKVAAWSDREEEYVRRAAFALLAELAIHDKRAPDECFSACFPLIITAAVDERNFVKKAVNWAVRQIGKRNIALNAQAIALSRDLQQIDSRSARWIAADALRELQGDAVQGRLQLVARKRATR